MSHTRRVFCALLTIGFFAAASGQAAEDKLPSADEVLTRYIQATGGEEAHRKIKTRVEEGTVELAGMNISMEMKAYHERPNRMRLIITSPAMGKMEQGVTGDTVWEINAMTGAAIKEGEEKAFLLRHADFDSDLKWKTLFPERKTVGEEEIDGVVCYKVELTPKDGKPETRYYAKDSGLLQRMLQTQITPQGEIPATIDVSDYREVEGIKMPFESRVSLMGMTQIIKLTKVELNVDIPDEMFELPEEIKELQADK